jgi:hypothetical protein
MAWWEFEAGDLAHPGYFRERSTLWRAGILGPTEKLEVEREWRAEFDAARRMGVRERRAHLEHHDVPSELIEQWSDRPRRKRTQALPTGSEAPFESEAT